MYRKPETDQEGTVYMTPATSTETEIDFEAEARLDPAIEFSSELSANPLNPRSVFLTGATGFLGVYLLDELLAKTRAGVFCLVRAGDAFDGMRRLVAHLRNSGLWQDSFATRIHAVAGDLEKPRFGLTDEVYRDLAGRIDVIYHNGGSVNMAFPYERLKPINVGGTLEVLRFAGQVRTKPVHFISSMAVFFTAERENGELLKESDTPAYSESLRSGYSKTKWVADRLVAEAHHRGLPGCIYRPVRIMGHSRTGDSSDTNDILPNLLKACILLGCCPQFDIEITLVPIDYVCEAAVHLASRRESWGRAFHLVNPSPIPWNELMNVLRAAGYPLQDVSYSDWWRAMKQRTRPGNDSGERNLFARIMMALTAPNFLYYKRPPFENSFTREGLAGTPIGCPPVDCELINAYLASWQKSGFLFVPDGSMPLAVPDHEGFAAAAEA